MATCVFRYNQTSSFKPSTDYVGSNNVCTIIVSSVDVWRHHWRFGFKNQLYSLSPERKCVSLGEFNSNYVLKFLKWIVVVYLYPLWNCAEIVFSSMLSVLAWIQLYSVHMWTMHILYSRNRFTCMYSKLNMVYLQRLDYAFILSWVFCLP